MSTMDEYLNGNKILSEKSNFKVLAGHFLKTLIYVKHYYYNYKSAN
jgi:hypothetical protein